VAAPVTFLIFFLFALFEEIGWMGYAFGTMAARRNAPTASVLLGTLWAGWHVPLYLLSGQGAVRVLVQLLSLVALRALIVWLFSNSGHSLLAAILTHATYNVCTLAFPSFYTDTGHLFTSGLIIVTGLLVLVLWHPESRTQHRSGEARPA
jgi:membrane protease YdiL (CAAX protease family)